MVCVFDAIECRVFIAQCVPSMWFVHTGPSPVTALIVQKDVLSWKMGGRSSAQGCTSYDIIINQSCLKRTQGCFPSRNIVETAKLLYRSRGGFTKQESVCSAGRGCWPLPELRDPGRYSLVGWLVAIEENGHIQNLQKMELVATLEADKECIPGYQPLSMFNPWCWSKCCSSSWRWWVYDKSYKVIRCCAKIEHIWAIANFVKFACFTLYYVDIYPSPYLQQGTKADISLLPWKEDLNWARKLLMVTKDDCQNTNLWNLCVMEYTIVFSWHLLLEGPCRWCILS